MRELSREQARRIAVRAPLLDDDRPVELVDTIPRLWSVQVDATRAVAPSADLVLWTRLGLGHSTTHLAAALAAGRVVEHGSHLYAAADVDLLRPGMRAWRTGRGLPAWARPRVEWVAANAAFRRDVLARLRESGPTTAREVPDTCAVSWRSSGWNDDRNAVMMLESLERRGEVARTGARRGRDVVWDLAERVLPTGPEVRQVPAGAARRERAWRELRALGLVRERRYRDPVEAREHPAVGTPVTVEGLPGRWRVDPGQFDQPFEGRVALLSPLDRLVFDRERMTDLFGFDYQLEMYKPAAARRFGFWALPVLAGDELIGKVDATADRRAGVLRVDAVHRDGAWDDELAGEVDDEIAALAFWLQLEVERRC